MARRTTRACLTERAPGASAHRTRAPPARPRHRRRRRLGHQQRRCGRRARCAALACSARKQEGLGTGADTGGWRRDASRGLHLARVARRAARAAARRTPPWPHVRLRRARARRAGHVTRTTARRAQDRCCARLSSALCRRARRQRVHVRRGCAGAVPCAVVSAPNNTDGQLRVHSRRTAAHNQQRAQAGGRRDAQSRLHRAGHAGAQIAAVERRASSTPPPCR